ncbi:CHAT domain-containing protein [Glycomyces sp. NRRL B-16210]|uniref:CHAT domain-containing protein n=1 Tax=Glycomyces sp. NRRL B-16210 TaxID=1463821 RepID=UPI0004C28906|nr:CHAT domain-containing protein [Glycomyces sp. NRRL B-16210]
MSPHEFAQRLESMLGISADGDAESRLDALRERAIASRDPGVLDLVASLFRSLVSQPEGARIEDLASLAEILWARAEIVRDINDLHEMVAVGRAWLAGAPDSHPDRAFRLWRLGTAEFGRSVMLGEPARLDQAIDCCRAAVAAASGDDPHRRTYIADLALGLQQRANATGRIEDLHAAVDGWKAAVAATPADHEDHGSNRFNLGSMHWQRFEATGEAPDLDAAVASWRAALDRFPVGHRYHGTVAPLLAEALRVRADRSGAVADADEAVRVVKGLIDSGGSEEDAGRLQAALGNALLSRYTVTGSIADLEQAVAAGRSAFDGTAPSSPFFCQRASNLSRALVALFQRTSRFEDIAEAADLALVSLRTIPVGMVNRGPVLSNAGNALRELAERTGELADLETAADLFRSAIEAFPPGDHQRAAVHSNLATTLLQRAERTGELEQIDEAVAVARGAFLEAAEGSPLKVGLLANLAAVFRARYQLTGDARDLDEALDAADEALTRTPASHPGRAARASTLTAVLVNRYRRFGEREALDEAVLVGREALDLAPAEHVHRPLRCTYLAGAHLDRYLSADPAGRDLADLEAAVSLAREAVTATGEGDPLRPVALANLAEMLHRRFTESSDRDDLLEAIALARHALASTPEDSPNRTNMHWVLAKALGDLSGASGDEASDSAAVANFAAAAAVPTGPVSLRVRAAHLAARTLMLQGESASARALPLLRAAVGLLPRLARHGLDRGDRRHLLEAEAGALAADAAACAIAAGDPEEAVRLLEQGRGLLWGQLLDLRTEPDQLREAHPDLAAELATYLAVLDPIGAEGPSNLVAEPLRHQSRAAHRLDDLLARIRALPPTERFPDPAAFMGPPRLASLMPPPGTGPVVILNASRWRCDALVLSPDVIEVVPLRFTQAELAAETNRYLNALQRNTGPKRDPELEAEANRVLEWLWDNVTEPVLGHLGFGPRKSGLPRIWWCPTGALTLLPIHAAGYHGRDDGSAVLDRAVSSYAPTLRALAHARSRAVPQDPDPAPLLVSIAETPGPFARLPGVAKERRMFTELFGAEITSLSEGAATREAIIAGLSAHSMAHIASHGVQDLRWPAEGGLVPFDWETAGLVRVDDLAQIAPGPRGLAFLSACQTATGGAVNLDEAMNVAAAMQYTGWTHVIGTLWTVFDGAASFVAERFYRGVLQDGRVDLSASAFALHKAVRALRAEAPRDAAYWARFVHLGP